MTKVTFLTPPNNRRHAHEALQFRRCVYNFRKARWVSRFACGVKADSAGPESLVRETVVNRAFATTIESVFDRLRDAGVLPADLQQGLDMLVDARRARLA